MKRLPFVLLTLVWSLSLVPAAGFISVSQRLLEHSPGQEVPLKMFLLVALLWLYPVTVAISLALMWRRRSPSLGLAPALHIGLALAVVFLLGTFA